MRSLYCGGIRHTEVRTPAVRLPIRCNTAVAIGAHVPVEAHIAHGAYGAGIAEQDVTYGVGQRRGRTYALRHTNEYMQARCSARPLGAAGAPTSAPGSHWKKMVMLRVEHAADASPPQNVSAKPP